MHRLNSVALLVALLAFPLRISAQSIHGELLELESRNPVEGALVLLVDERGAEAAGVFTNAHGRFLLQAPAPGRYSIRAERIGLKTTSSPVVSVGAGAAVEQRLLLPLDVRKLKALEVEAESRCTVRPEVGQRTAALWENARKALTAAQWGRGLYRYRVNQFQRKLDPQTLRVMAEENQARGMLTDEPYVSLPAEQLAREGYMTRDRAGGYAFNAPDAKVLLSDSFLDSHCFSYRPGGKEKPGLVGLTFEPVQRREITDVKGVLWIDVESSELRSLEFQYANLPLDGRVETLGGRLEFERLAEGPWIVREWTIRMPVVATATSISGSFRNSRDLVGGVQEVGARVLEVISLQSKKSADVGEIAGTVTDASGTRPVAGGTVFLDGTSFSSVTDAQGRFQIPGVREGRYTIRFFHPDLDVSLPPREVVLGRGQTAEVQLRLP